MDITDIGKGSIVQSVAGRDKGHIFFVLDTIGDYALLVDGKIRRIENPKTKKIKHVRFLARREDMRVYSKIAAGIRPDNAELRKAVALFADSENESS
jgi:ribosomal protein L14E/L6E/L27E